MTKLPPPLLGDNFVKTSTHTGVENQHGKLGFGSLLTQWAGAQWQPDPLFGCAGSSLLRVHGLSLVAESRGYPLAVAHGFLIAVASVVAEHRL